MDFDTIDWNALWEAEAAGSHWNKMSQKELWNKRAASFSRSISQTVENGDKLDKEDYISKMLDRIEVKPGWSVLDIGSGPGTLAIPLAKKARSVTALDLSPEMLRHLKANASLNGLNNIRYLNASWQEAYAGKMVGEHDVVVASRSIMSGSIKDALAFISSVTLRAAYLTFPIIHQPLDWEAYRAIGKTGKKYPPYIYVYNLLFQMGIPANVEILRSRVKLQFSSIEDAMESIQWRTDPFTPAEKTKLAEFLEKKFAEQKNTGFTHEGYSQWALIWWRTVS
jgi:SAM-dependent methyltransferase